MHASKPVRFNRQQEFCDFQLVTNCICNLIVKLPIFLKAFYNQSHHTSYFHFPLKLLYLNLNHLMSSLQSYSFTDGLTFSLNHLLKSVLNSMSILIVTSFKPYLLPELLNIWLLPKQSKR